jgi:hypothetical protein
MRYLALSVVTFASGWHIIGQGIASGSFTIAAASGTAIRPTAIRMKVTASPNIRTVAGYSIQCRRGTTRKKAKGTVTGLTPITKAIPLPLAHPARCVVVANATLTSKTSLTVTILSR